MAKTENPNAPPREERAFLTFFPRKGGAYGMN